MANVDKPNGFRPYKKYTGENWNGSFVKCYAAANLFMGDAVIRETTGVTNGDGAFQSVARAADLATAVIHGVVVGWEPNPSNLENLYHVGSASTYAVYICVDPDVTYLIQGDDGGSNAVTNLDVGMNIDGLVAAGSTTTGLSNMEVDQSVTGLTTTAGLHLVSIPDIPGNVVGDDNCLYEVMFPLTTYHNAGVMRMAGV